MVAVRFLYATAADTGHGPKQTIENCDHWICWLSRNDIIFLCSAPVPSLIQDDIHWTLKYRCIVYLKHSRSRWMACQGNPVLSTTDTLTHQYTSLPDRQFFSNFVSTPFNQTIKKISQSTNVNIFIAPFQRRS